MNLLFEVEAPCIEGLSYIPDFINYDEENALIAEIDSQSWLNDLKRRVQHYGYKYDYRARTVTNDAYLGPLPKWMESIIHKLPFKPDQAIINEYQPGQGISAHIDCVPCFGDIICSLSLGSDAVMQFTNKIEKREIFLEQRSFVALSGPARYEWQHSIPARKSDIIGGVKVQRGRRLSLTFRTIVLN